MELITKTIPIIRDLSLNPSCAHGPAILFQRNSERFFTCSAYRSRNLCSFYMTEDQWNRSKVKSSSKEDSSTEPDKKRQKLSKISNPLIVPHQDNKGEAQYHFSLETTEFFTKQLDKLGYDGVLCVGTPSLHEQLVKNRKRSFLLDIDARFSSIHRGKMCLYNMCNHHFFEDSSDYKKFLENAKRIVVILDPPFGVKPELIWHGCLKGIQRDFCKEDKDQLDFDIFWIFPYFNEGHLMKCSETLKMSDFHVEYSNHSKYKRTNNSQRKASPIRVFTTVPLSEIELPKELYRFCQDCSKWVDKKNLHCNICEVCPTKDGGSSYTHCYKCGKCVKPTWSHCRKCSSCHLIESGCKRQVVVQETHKTNSNIRKKIKRRVK